MIPHPTLHNGVHARERHAETFGKACLRNPQSGLTPNDKHAGARQFGVGVFFPIERWGARLSPVAYLVVDVFGGRSPCKIGESVVGRIPVQVSALQPVRAGAHKRLQDNVVGVGDTLIPGIVSKRVADVSEFVMATAQQRGRVVSEKPARNSLSSCKPANAATGRDFVEAFKPNNLAPKFFHGIKYITEATNG